MADDSLRAKWDARHGDAEKSPSVARVLEENLHLLPPSGHALDLACGLGGNALVLAEQGLDVSAWDLSPVAIERLQGIAAAEGLTNLQAEVRDVERQPPSSGSFDVIVVSYYLERTLIPALISALKPGGLIFYQTFTAIAVGDEGPSNPDFRLGDNELLDLFRPLKVRCYREEDRLGDLTRGVRDVAMLVAERSVSGLRG
ncbi:MAG: methyltransferase domain-containing protein [Candidatus Thiodiazotropha sp. (ex Monitilora ramsayi)]|nr:methyltransferase domain-containing protein [Candidatus Thiodiazotropha sp. (ex Monitilora ramsayi)]